MKTVELCIILLFNDTITGEKLSIMPKDEAVLRMGIRQERRLSYRDWTSYAVFLKNNEKCLIYVRFLLP